KRLPILSGGDTEFAARFRREAAIAARLQSPHIVPIHDYGDIGGRLFIDMRLVNGTDLAKLLAGSGPLDPARAVKIIEQVASALDDAHAERLVHRDVKPSNVLLTGKDFAYLADFGVARAVSGGPALTVTGSVVGTPAYIAPERFQDQPDDHLADIYALGCVLYEALTGSPPFGGQGLAALMYAHINQAPPRASAQRRGLPAALDEVIARGMAKDPRQRFPTAGELASAASDALRGPASTAPRNDRPRSPTTVVRVPGIPPAPPDPVGGGRSPEQPNPAPPKPVIQPPKPVFEPPPKPVVQVPPQPVVQPPPKPAPQPPPKPAPQPPLKPVVQAPLKPAVQAPPQPVVPAPPKPVFEPPPKPVIQPPKPAWQPPPKPAWQPPPKPAWQPPPKPVVEVPRQAVVPAPPKPTLKPASLAREGSRGSALPVRTALLVLLVVVAMVVVAVVKLWGHNPLERFYTQGLAWTDCSSFAVTSRNKKAYAVPGLQCAHLSVPLDYANPDGRIIKLGLLRRPALDQAHRVGSLVINPGGPGESGMSTAASLADQVANNDIGGPFDLVGFDPRGVGASEPRIVCRTDAERDAERQMNLGVDTTQREGREKNDNGGCASRIDKDVLANIGTRDVVRDLDIMRSALGDEKLTYLGYGDGSLIGTGYAEAFPGKVRAMILDGPVDPAYGWDARRDARSRVQQRGFDSFVEWCVQRSGCALGTERGEAQGRYRELVRQLVDNPAKVNDGRRLSYSDAVAGTILLLWSPGTWEKLNDGLKELGQHSGDILMGSADVSYRRSDDGTYSNLADVYQSILCVDYPSGADPNSARRREVAPFYDIGISPARDECAFWPVPPTRKPGSPRTSGLPRVLVIATKNDFVVDYDIGVSVARELDARLLTLESSQAYPFLRVHNHCVDQAGISYLKYGQLPPEGTKCPPEK
ncbi:MAG TPA: alpha/beta fold hydrolase, partial [Pseudonocardiaceae bacterium]|nr:alpha/beta fold hydrolase [Pseudonocardiaceae bacterium]